jgi:hypothetical protein
MDFSGAELNRHCEPQQSWRFRQLCCGEAIQRAAKQDWIASSQVLLAMTAAVQPIVITSTILL